LTHTELKKKIVDSVIKFAKKNLRNEGAGIPAGKRPAVWHLEDNEERM